MKNNENKKSNKKTIYIVAVFLIAIISICFVFNYYFGTWICYQDNIPPAGAETWNTAISYRIKITRAGIIYGNSGKEKLNKDELKELKELIKEIKDGEVDETYDTHKDGLFINGKSYEIDEENKDEYQRIEKLIK